MKTDLKNIWSQLIKDNDIDKIKQFLSSLKNKKLEFIDKIPKTNFWNLIPEKFKKIPKVSKLKNSNINPYSNVIKKFLKNLTHYSGSLQYVYFKKNYIIASNSVILMVYYSENIKDEYIGIYCYTKYCVKNNSIELPIKINHSVYEVDWNFVTKRISTEKYYKFTLSTKNLSKFVIVYDKLFYSSCIQLVSSKYGISTKFRKGILKTVMQKIRMLNWNKFDIYISDENSAPVFIVNEKDNIDKIKTFATTFFAIAPITNNKIELLYYNIDVNRVMTNGFDYTRLLELIELKNKNAEAEFDLLAKGLINSIKLADWDFQILETDGQFHELIGNPSLPFYIMLYGKPGSGKSTLSIQLAKYLADKNLKVLYYAKEESRRNGFSYTLKEKFNRLNAYSPNLYIANTLPDLKNYNILIIDSVNDARLTPEQLEQLQEKYPHLSMILVFQSTKDGNFRGEQTWQHIVDTVITVENGTAKTGKNRFAAHGEINILFGRENWLDKIKVGIPRKKLINLLKKNGWNIDTKKGKGSHIVAKKNETVLVIPKNLNKKGILLNVKKKIENEELKQ